MDASDMDAVLQRLYARRSFGIRPGLEMTAAVMERLDRPQDSYRVVHIAGTNGKGSTAAMLDSTLRAAGLRTGLYTSPHLVRFNERFRVNGVPISDTELANVLADIEEAAAVAAGGLRREATFFEYATAVAFEHFRRENVEIAVVETGMGGRLDATNVVTPALTIITRIGMDHTLYLGSTLEEIAEEKCGIIKAGCPLVTGAMDGEAFRVVARSAAAAGVTHVAAPDAVSVEVRSAAWFGQKVRIESETASYGTVDFPLAGEHQIENLGTAVAAAEALASMVGLPLTEDHIRGGVAGVEWPARCQVLKTDPLVVLDGAHNPGGARVLARTFSRLSGRSPLGLIVGMCDDKDLQGFLGEFPGAGGRLWAVPVPSERSLGPDEVCAAAQRLGWKATAGELVPARGESERWAAENGGVVCITGSLFLAGAVLGMLDE